jgi:S1-C subfamily serine protease
MDAVLTRLMRPSGLVFFAAWLAAAGLGDAQEKVVQSFDGTAALATPNFQVQDKWEVRWDSADITQITVLAADGTVVAGAAGSQKGSLYLPKGGTFNLKISRPAAAAATQWHITVVEIGSAPNPVPVASNYLPPETLPAAATTNAAPAPTPPAAAPATASTTTPATTGGLSEDQARAVVEIKGDVGEGTGFLVKTADGPAVVTNIHVLSANPNVKILTTTGAQIKMLGVKGASDRDLAMISIQDDHYTYLDLATDIANTVQAGDEVITPGNSEGGEVMLNTKGTVLGIGPQMVEISNPIYHGNSGGPVSTSRAARSSPRLRVHTR